MPPSPADFPAFKLKGRPFVHLGGGWCLSEVKPTGRPSSWRVYWGAVAEGGSHPAVPNNFLDGDAPVEFASFAAAAAWVISRRPRGS